MNHLDKYLEEIQETYKLNDSNKRSIKMNHLDKHLKEIQLDEAVKYKPKRTTITRVTRQTKIDRAIGALSTKYAKETNDSLYKKMVKYRDKFYKYRDLIRKKFGARVRSRALSGKGISDMFKDKQKSGAATGKIKTKPKKK